MSDVREDIQRLWCQHCKALQKSNDTIVDCWYNPLDEEAPAFCAANCDAVDSFFALDRIGVIAEDQGLETTQFTWSDPREVAHLVYTVMVEQGFKHIEVKK